MSSIEKEAVSISQFNKSEPTMDLLDRLLGHDSWTTAQFLQVASTLGDEQLDQQFDIAHGSVRRTFEHMFWNIECWTDLMKGNAVRDRAPAGRSINELMESHKKASAELFRFAREIADQNRFDDTFVDILDDPHSKKTFGGTILHLATHSMHHRAQLLYMFRLLGLKDLPEGDVLEWEQTAG